MRPVALSGLSWGPLQAKAWDKVCGLWGCESMGDRAADKAEELKEPEKMLTI